MGSKMKIEIYEAQYSDVTTGKDCFRSYYRYKTKRD